MASRNKIRSRRNRVRRQAVREAMALVQAGRITVARRLLSMVLYRGADE